MQITVEELSSIKKKINFEIPVERVSKEIDKAYDNIRKRASIKGFRKGKAPQSYIEKHYGDAMADDVMRTIFNETYFQALRDHNVVPASHPELETDGVVAGQPLKYSATVEVVPEVGTVDYKGLSAEKETYTPDPEKVEARLQQFRENMAQYTPVDSGHAAAMGDMVTIDFTGYLDGVPFDGGQANDHQLVLGSGSFIPGFEEQLVGLNPGDQKDITLTFPEEYHAKELAGKETVFSVTVKEIKLKELPELDDDFAKEMGEFETLEQLRARVAETMDKQETDRIENDLKDQLVNALVAKNDLEVPASLVERQIDTMLDGSKKRLASQGMTLEMMGLDEAGYRVQFRDVAEQKVKSSLLMSAMVKQEGLTVDEADIDEQLKRVAADNGHDFDKMKEFYTTNAQAKESLADYILDTKVFKLLTENAKITEKAKA